MTTAKVQHYVPQFLLRNFGNGKKDQVWVYDKVTDRSFPTNAKNIASESRFYDFELDGTAITLEPMLSKLEGNAKPIIKKILEADSLVPLTDEEKAMLSAFLSIQHTRTRTFREQWNDFPRMLREHLASRGEIVANGSQAANLIRDLTENESKAETGRFMMQAPQEFASHFLAKQWLLAATTRKHPFLVSDNPLTLQNMNDMSPRGNLGLAVRGIEIYFPLSPVRALAMWCPSLLELIRQGAEACRRFPQSRAKENLSDSEGLLALEEAINTGRPAVYNKENVENFNSLQISQSERYVFSSVNDFHLAKDMLQAHPSLQRGPRATVA
jgi:hypothetical protein